MSNIFPIFDTLIARNEFEQFLGQKGQVLWIVGQSGSGKSTIAAMLQRKLFEKGKYVIVLDGDNLRSGLNSGLGFSTEDRLENIRRAAEVSKLLVQNGAIVLACFVCPLEIMRDKAKEILGDDYCEVYIKTSLETLIKRDTKGFYKKALEGKMEQLTGINSEFEEPSHPDILIDTDIMSIEASVDLILKLIS